MNSSSESSDPLPLTRAQVPIWLGRMLSPKAPLYNMALAFTLNSHIDGARFSRAWQFVVDHSDALRCTFHLVDSRAAQAVRKPFPVTVREIDFSRETNPHQTALAWCQSRCRQPFDLTQQAFDSALLKLSNEQSIWFLNQHHLVTDAWSLALVFKRTAYCYEALSASETALPAAATAWPSFAGSILQPGEHSVSRESPDTSRPTGENIVLPRFYGRPATGSSESTTRLTHELGTETSCRLRSLMLESRFRQFTPHLSQFCFFATVFFAWQFRVSQQTRLSLGCPAHKRHNQKLRETIGLFMELAPLQVEVLSDDSFADLFERVVAATHSFLRETANDQVAENATGGRTPYNCVLNYITAEFGEFCGQPVESRWIHAGAGDPGHLIRLQVHDFDSSGRFHLHFDLNDDLFEPHERSRVASHFQHLLDAFLENPEQPIEAVPIVDAQERSVLVQQTQPAIERDDFTSVLAMIDKRAQSHPDSIAVVCGETTLSYQDLSEAVTTAANRIEDADLGPSVVVPVYLPRSIDAVVAALAVMKTGRTWLPIDSVSPPRRVEQLMTASGAKTIITNESLSRPIASEYLCLTNITNGAINEDSVSTQDDFQKDVNPGQAAYMIFTSGSTGTPKGVQVSHAAFANYVTWARDTYSSEATIRMPLFTSLSFDLTITSVFVPLASGGTVFVYPEMNSPTDSSLLDVLADNFVDTIKLTPAHLAMIQDRRIPNSQVRQLILGGENLSRELAMRGQAMFGDDTLIWNEYGPTEATVGCLIHRFHPTTDADASVPIGRPIQDMQAFVLNQQRQLCPAGTAGELYLAGSSLADGYRNLPEETERRFVTSAAISERRLYRTGDLARVRDDGVFEFLGRVDEQIKIRGVRIEPTELETVINRIDGVTGCAVATVGHRVSEDPVHCSRCGLESSYPDVSYDEDGVCNLCLDFDEWKENVHAWFRTPDDFVKLFHQSKHNRSGSAKYDCLAMLSGGKDSTYVVCQLVDLGLKVLAFTLDNGYLSTEAKANIDRVVAALEIDHVYESTPAMNAIFVDSLQRHSNVCHGCFKTAYSLALQTAVREEIPVIVTGLSRGQFFETRLTRELFDGKPSVEDIDATILAARRAYHRVDDAVRQLLDTKWLQEDRVFEDVRFVDFFRYHDVPLSDVLHYLQNRVPWKRPSDTGRSTNCLINDVGIYVHKKRHGFHNYAFPYSWDVRIGHKTRDEAIDELNDEIDDEAVFNILDEIGFQDSIEPSNVRQLVAWVTTSSDADLHTIRETLRDEVPPFMLPDHILAVPEIPLTENGKVDRAALAQKFGRNMAADSNRNLSENPRLDSDQPWTETETQLRTIWDNVLPGPAPGRHQNFFRMGGDSIMAIRIVTIANQEGFDLAPGDLFENQTIAKLAKLIESNHLFDCPDAKATDPPDASPENQADPTVTVSASAVSQLAQALRKKDDKR